MDALTQQLAGKDLATKEDLEKCMSGLVGQDMDELTEKWNEGRAPTDESKALARVEKAHTAKTRLAARRELDHALKRDSDCVEALHVRGDFADSPEAAEQWYRKAVSAGDRQLADVLAQKPDYLWAHHPARSYLRAREKLSYALGMMDRINESIAENEAILVLNKPDNQGVRYRLLGQFLELGRDADAQKLIGQFSHDADTCWAFSRALLEFRRLLPQTGWGSSEGDSETWMQQQLQCMNVTGMPPKIPKLLRKADKLLIKAIKGNPWSAMYLMNIPAGEEQPFPETYGIGDEDEAIVFIHRHVLAWTATPEALLWLLIVATPWLAKEGYADEMERIMAMSGELDL